MNRAGFRNTPIWMQKNWETLSNSTPSLWLNELRQDHWQLFNQAGLPTQKEEHWKNIDLSFLYHKVFSTHRQKEAESIAESIHQYRLQKSESILLVSVNGIFVPALSDLNKLPEKIIASNLSQAYSTHQEIMTAWWQAQTPKKYPFANLNAAMSTDGLFLCLPDGCEITTPIHLLSIIIDAKNCIAHPRHIIMLGHASKLTLIEEHFSLAEYDYMVNNVTTIMVGKNAALAHYKIQKEGKEAIHMSHTFVLQMQDSKTMFANFSSGSAFARDDLVVKLQEPGAACQAIGFYHLDNDDQQIVHHLDIDHMASGTKSEMLYKGVLKNKSRAIFNGRVHVAKEAQKTVAYQANHNLLLSRAAEIYVTPILEIYADDVKCKHGATVGQLDQAALFYLRSRGIEESEAIHILLQGFLDEIFQQIPHPGIRAHAKATVQSI